jgi:hypothetical protein
MEKKMALIYFEITEIEGIYLLKSYNWVEEYHRGGIKLYCPSIWSPHVWTVL